MSVLLLAHLVVGLGLVAAGGRVGRRAALVAALPEAATAVWLAGRAGPVLDGEVAHERIAWVPRLGLQVDLRLDGFAALWVGLVSGIGVLVFLYSRRYLRAGGAGQGRLLGLLVLFAGSMLGLVLSDNLIVLFGFWELTSLTSFLLIGIEHTSDRARAAALQALLVTGVGGLALLGGFVLIGQSVEGGGTFRMSEVLASPPAGAPVTVGLVLVLVGAFTKSAQYPFHAWLPAAMVAPTPVSAYLHSATMVKAGIYVIARFAPAFAGVWLWRPLVVVVGLVTMVAGALHALRQHDLKLILAYSTVSQLGLMVVVFGTGTAETVVDASELLLAHALFKAALFMVAGIVDHQAGTRDIRLLRRPGPGWRPATAVTVVSAASMAGVPLAFGFVAKEDILIGLEDAAFANAGAVLGLVVAASVLTVAYSARLVWGVLGGAYARAGPGGSGGDGRVAPPPAGAFLAPAAVPAALTVLLGVVPRLADGIMSVAGRALTADAGPVHLVVWHGWDLSVLLSAVVLGGGAALFAGRRRVEPILALGRGVPSGGEAYLATLRTLNRVADRVTAVVQSGSLPVYAGVVLTTAAVLPTAALVLGEGSPGSPALVGSVGQVPACAAIIVAALAAARVRRRFAAALLLGATGYAMAGLFVAVGGSDLALTQVAIETLSTVLFVLVLRWLPNRFEVRSARPLLVVRVVAAVSVGVMVFTLALVAGSDRPDDPVSDEMVADAVPEAGGRNVVNVILVDFRGLDTMGEITVLAAAAIGSVALARAGRRPGGEPARRAPAVERLVVVDVAVRLVFPAVMVGSVYLLFAGHNRPGGGFVGGIVASAGIALRYVAGGIDDVRNLSRAHPWTVLGTGLLVAAATVLVPLLAGGAPLESALLEAELPLLGHVEVTSALAFDIGVYLLVLGLVLMVFEAFGDEPPPAAAPADAGAPAGRDRRGAEVPAP